MSSKEMDTRPGVSWWVTTDKAEYDRLVRLGWVGEGVRFCAEPPKARLKQLTVYRIAHKSEVGDHGPTLSTGVSLSIKGDTLKAYARNAR